MESSKNKVPMIDLRRQYEPLHSQVMSALDRVVRSGQFILGPDVDAFEKEVSEYLGVGFSYGVTSGTDALWLALKAVGVKPGDRVLTTPFTFFATISATMNVGAIPVFADVDRDTFNLNVESVRRILEADKEKTIRAIIAVHLYGLPAEMEGLNQVAKEFGVPVIEDAAQAIGATLNGVKVGGLGSAGCFSFYPTKNLGAMGDAGLVTANDPAIAAELKRLRVHGASKTYHHDTIGGNFRIDTLQTAILRVFLPHLEEWIEKRRKIASLYQNGLSGVSAIVLPIEPKGMRHVYHQYTIQVKNGRRNELQRCLNEMEIGNCVYYPIACHLQEALSGYGYKRGLCPIAEELSDSVLSLPMFPEMLPAEVERVVAAIKSWA